jgi:hypothetical protein
MNSSLERGAKKDSGERQAEFLFYQIAMDTCRKMTDYGPLHHHRRG